MSSSHLFGFGVSQLTIGIFCAQIGLLIAIIESQEPNLRLIQPQNETSTGYPDLSSDFLCTFQAERNYAPPMDVCPAFFYQCANGRTFRQNCPPTLFYDRVRDWCNYPHLVPGCIGFNGTTLNTTELCNGRTPGFYANPDSCTSYIACVRSEEPGVVIPCGGGFVYDPDNGHCTLPKLVAWPCGYKVDRNVAVDACHRRPDGWQISSNCRTRRLCKHGAVQTMNCPLGLAFNRWARDADAECRLMVNVPGCAPPQNTNYRNICQVTKFGVHQAKSNSQVGVVCLYESVYGVLCTGEGFTNFNSTLRKCV